MKEIKVITLVLFVLVLSISCGVNNDPVLLLTGKKEVSLSKNELESMPIVDSNYTNKDGEATVFSGISIVEILETQGVEKYSELTLIASDGYTASVSYDELSVCSECILSYSEDNNWSTVMPNFSGKLQVKDVVELSVK